MALTAVPVASDLLLVVDNGVGASGRQLTRIRSYRDVHPASSNQDLYQAAQAIAGLQSRPLLAIHRQDTVELLNV